jgi:hypothetical protein
MSPYPPKSRRTVLSATAVALLAASPLLAACGSPDHPGAAAVVEGKKITVSELQAKVEDVREAQRDSEQSAQLIADSGRLSQLTLNNMIFVKVLDRAVGDAGVTVSPADVQQGREVIERAMGGAEQMRVTWLQRYSIAPGEVEETIRNQVAIDKLAQSMGADRASADGQQKIFDALSAASAKMGITVNPRFGTWDGKQVQLGFMKEPWLRPAPVRNQPV